MTFTARISSPSNEGRRRHIAIIRGTHSQGWALAWAEPTPFGHKYAPPFRTGIRTRREAEAIRKRIYDGGEK